MMFEMRVRKTDMAGRDGRTSRNALHPGTEGADIECQCTLPPNEYAWNHMEPSSSLLILAITNPTELEDFQPTSSVA